MKGATTGYIEGFGSLRKVAQMLLIKLDKCTRQSRDV